jgi:putative transposase
MRNKRILKDGAIYHVIARINRRELILNSPAIKELFLKIVTLSKKRYRFLVKNFCVMGNHIHIIMQPDTKECLSRIMQWILSVFAASYNRRFKLMGHVWYDRFKSFILNDLRDFLKTFRYINENPVKAGIVKAIEDFHFGGIGHYKSGNYSIISPPDLLCRLFFPEIVILRLLSEK